MAQSLRESFEKWAHDTWPDLRKPLFRAANGRYEPIQLENIWWGYAAGAAAMKERAAQLLLNEPLMFETKYEDDRLQMFVERSVAAIRSLEVT